MESNLGSSWGKKTKAKKRTENHYLYQNSVRNSTFVMMQ
jgi:hypothetical protein